LSVRERNGDELPELQEPLLRVLGELLVAGQRHDDRPPELAGHLDRGRDERPDPEGAERRDELRLRVVGVVDVASRRSSRSTDARDRAAEQLDASTDR
jgi:hypothetical protein